MGLVVCGNVMAIYGPPGRLDSRFFYSGEDVHWLNATLSLPLRKDYVVHQLFDFGYMVLYSGLFVAGLAWALRVSKAALLGVVPAVFDFFENIGTLAVLFGRAPEDVVNRLGYVTATKWLLAAIVLAAIVGGSAVRSRSRRDK